MLLSLLLGSKRTRRRRGDAQPALSRQQLVLLGAVCCLALLAVLGLGRSFASLAAGLGLSQQCRMSRMWPAYAAHQPPSPSGLGRKYSLFLYRERGPHGHPSDDRPTGTPALFIPGNAGHYGQIRSVASSCATQYYQGNGMSAVKPEWSRARGPIDWWTVHFNEDFSAFHAQTMLDQATYVNEVIAYLLTLYAPVPGHSNVTSVPILAHSMGGIVARLLLEQPNYVNGSVDTIITLSTPHVFPPAPFDRSIESVYKRVNRPARSFSSLVASAGSEPVALEAARRSFPRFADVLLISVGSGALDTQITSESSALALGSPDFPPLWPAQQAISTFSSALPGLWSSVGHVSMVWCDQLRERIARASMMDALLFETSASRRGLDAVRKRKALWERFLGDNAEWGGTESQQSISPALPSSDNVQSSVGEDVDHQSTVTFDLAGTHINSTLDLEVITDLTVGNDPTLGLGVIGKPEMVIQTCKTSVSCSTVPASDYTLLPSSSFSPTLSQATEYSPSILFPHAETRYELPGQGLRRWSVNVAKLKGNGYTSVKVSKADHSRASGFFRAGWTRAAPVIVLPTSSSTATGLLSSMTLDISGTLEADIKMPGLSGALVHFLAPSMDSSLLAYRLELDLARCDSSSTTANKLAFSPMLQARHRGTGDAVWFPSLLESQQGVITLTTHADRLRMSLYASSPYVPPASGAQHGTFFTLFFDPASLGHAAPGQPAACAIGGLHSITVRVDWMMSLGLLAMRYRFAALVFPFAMLCMLAGLMWEEWNQDVLEAAQARPEDEDDGLSSAATGRTLTPDAPFPALLPSLWTHGPRVLLILSCTSILLAMLQGLMVKLVGTRDAFDQGMLDWLLGYPGPASFSFIALGPVLLLAAFAVFALQTAVLVGLIQVLATITAFTTTLFSAVTPSKRDTPQQLGAIKANGCKAAYSSTTLIALGSVVLAVFFVLPYQLAFLIATLAQLLNTVRAYSDASRERKSRQLRIASEHHRTSDPGTESFYNQQMLIFVLMMGVLPIRAPVLLVWARNVLLGVRAPATTPGIGDHNVLEVISFILAVQVGASGRLFQRAPSRLLARLTQLLFSLAAIKSLTWGLRYAYLLYDGLNILFAWLLFVQWRARSKEAVGLPDSGHTYAPVRQSVDGPAQEARYGDEAVFSANTVSASPATAQSRPSRQSAASIPFTPTPGSAPILRMDLPVELKDAALVLPASLAASADLSKTGTQAALSPPAATQNPQAAPVPASSDLDALLKSYLDLAALYHDLRTRSSRHFAQGHIDLVRARMQVGGWNLAKLGKDGWDARLSAQIQVRAECDEEGRLCGFRRFSPSLQGEGGEGEGGREDVQPYIIDEDEDGPASTLRQRRKTKTCADEPSDEKKVGPADADEDEKKGKEASADEDEKKPKRGPLPPDPLYQFAALPPPSLRSAKTHFEQALGLSLGSSSDGDEPKNHNVLAVVLEMARLSEAIRERSS
ncbi:GPI inositol deacylase [Tilletia horrida]|nr:GPI inositol deacylase [Tilletia horrida]